MASDSSPTPSQPGTYPRAPLVVAYLLLCGLLIYVLVARWFLPLYFAEPIGVESSIAAASLPAAFAPPDTRVNPNTASWMELTRLPGIGEVMAKRIVAYREENRSPGGNPIFRSPEDLDRVKGIGAKTISAIRDQLRFDEAAEDRPSNPINPR